MVQTTVVLFLLRYHRERKRVVSQDLLDAEEEMGVCYPQMAVPQDAVAEVVAVVQTSEHRHYRAVSSTKQFPGIHLL